MESFSLGVVAWGDFFERFWVLLWQLPESFAVCIRSI
jgi:hypothetical protein